MSDNDKNEKNPSDVYEESSKLIDSMTYDKLIPNGTVEAARATAMGVIAANLALQKQ